MHTYFQFKVLANHDEPNPSSGQAEKQAIVCLASLRSASLRDADVGECTKALAKPAPQ